MSRAYRSLGLALLIASCARSSSRGAAPGAEVVRRFAQAHRDADSAQARGDVGAARDALRRSLEAPVPEQMPPEDRRMLMQDAWFHLAELELPAHPQEAIALAGRGLEQGGDNLFTANLLAVRGRAREAVGADVAAADDLHRALAINSRLLAEALRPGSTP